MSLPSEKLTFRGISQSTTERQNSMGDKSPKSNQKKKSQKDAKAASKQNKKNKAVADKQKKS